MTDSLAEALAQLQADLPFVAKARRAQVKTDAGTYTYDYADLAAISSVLLPKLASVGLSFSAKPTLVKAGQFILVYQLRHVSGEKDGGQYPLPDPTKTKPQALGSAITYARRYALCSITGLAPESDDDDAREASRQRRAPSSNEAKLADLKGRVWSIAKTRGMDGAALVNRYEDWCGSALSDASVEDLQRFLAHLGETRTAKRARPAPAAEEPTAPTTTPEPEIPEPPLADLDPDTGETIQYGDVS